jgi:hypothetical protein
MISMSLLFLLNEKKNPFIFVSLVLSYIILLVNDVISCIYKPLAIVIFYDEMNVRVY